MMPESSSLPNAADLQRAHELVDRCRTALASRLVGQAGLSRALLVTLVAGGHILLESLPGLAKTLAASTLAHSVRAEFARIQCTPDLLPSDLIGTQIYDPGAAEFTTRLGPVHHNFVLVDEINRAGAKTQSALLEAMQERQTSIGGVTYRLPEPFMVLATQNPIDEEGTYVLPQAQMDRFLLKEIVGYPSPGEEIEILDRISDQVFDHEVDPALSLDDVRFLRRLAGQVYVDPAVKRYIVELLAVTRRPAEHLSGPLGRAVEYGASPRGGIALMKVAQSLALMDGRGHVLPQDIRAMRYAVLRHRILLTFEALAERVAVEEVIDAVFDAVPAR